MSAKGLPSVTTFTELTKHCKCMKVQNQLVPLLFGIFGLKDQTARWLVGERWS